MKADAGATRLFRDILLASGSIPGLFPPVFFDVEAQQRAIREVHADGGVTLPFYLAPEALINDGGSLPAREIYVVINNRLGPEFLPVQATTLSVLGNALSAAVKAGTRAALRLHGLFAHQNGMMLHTAAIDSSFRTSSSAPFDTKTMQALYDYARLRALQGIAFKAVAPAHSAEIL